MQPLARERANFIQLTPTIRRRLEATLENLIELLDALDGNTDLEDGHDTEDDPAELGVADHAGYIEQCVGEPSLGATVDLDQRLAWGADRLASVVDGEASGTADDLPTEFSYEARAASRQAAAAALDHARRLAARRHAATR